MDNSNKKRGAFYTTLILTCVFAGAGCASIPNTNDRALKVGESEVNLDVASSQEDLEARTNNLAEGLSEEEVFAALDIPKERFTKLRTDQKLPAIVSNAQPQPRTADDMQDIANFLDTLTVYQLPYKHTTEYGSVGFTLNVTQTETGFDRMLTLVFQDGELRRSDFDGRPDFLEVDKDNLLWGGVSKAGDTAVRVIRP